MAQHGHLEHHSHDQSISIVEAVLLSVVTIAAAWSGYSAAKWSTESSLHLNQATATRAKSNRAYQELLTLRTQDAANFNAWFTARLDNNANGERVAERRFRPEYDQAFRAWLATRPFTNASAPKSPQYMAVYKPAGAAEAKKLDAKADALYSEGEHSAITGDKYIRITVILASVLFIVGISSHFSIRPVRMGLVAVGAGLVVLAGVAILQLPGPPA